MKLDGTIKFIDQAISANAIRIKLSHEKLSFLPKAIEKLINLEELYANGNNLDQLPSGIVNLKKLHYLDLRDNKFKNIPIEVTLLTNLKTLRFSTNRLRSLPDEIYRLVNLEKFDLYDNQLDVLSSEIGKLKSLRVLYLYNNKLERLPSEIGRLENLQELLLQNNHIKALPPEISKIRSLTSLDISGNDISDLPVEISELSNLKTLNIGNNAFHTLPEIVVKLNNLEALYAHANQINVLPSEIRSLKNLKILDLRNNNLSIPPEILGKIKHPELIFDYYFNVQRNQKRYLMEAKVILVGQGSVGKTSIISRCLNNTFNTTENKTEGISIIKWYINRNSEADILQSKIQLNLWDFGGQEIMHATHQFFLTKRSLYLLVLDSRLTQEENRVEFWLKIIQSFGGESPVLIVGNKIDQHPLDIDRTSLQKKYPNIVGILETSAATGAGIEELKTTITEQVNNLPHVRDQLPETWFTVKTKLEELGRQSNFITHDKYLDLCTENEVSDETSQRTLIGFLHDLGVVLHFQDDPRLEALGILNPQWVTNGVYKILNSHALFQNKGVLTTSMLNEILNLPEYPRGKRLFIVDMMKKFELCYDIEPDKTFLVPDLLPKDQPDLTFNGVPAFEYTYPVLPSSVITRFIVRMNQKIDDGFVWRTGVTLKIGENKALVKGDIEDRKITIAIDGVEHTRRDALSAIRFQLDEIHGSIKGLDAQKRVPIPDAPNAEPLEYDYLLMLEREGQEVYLAKDKNRLVKVNIRQLLSGIESEVQRKESGNRVTNIYIGGDVNDSNILAGDENGVNK